MRKKAKVRTVPVDDMFGEMMNWAVRYAIGRRTYAAGDTCDYIIPLVGDLSNKTLWCIERDIESQMQFDGGLGDQCDEEKWISLLKEVKSELKNRGGVIR